MKARDIKKICREYNFVPLRRRGQNFLINSSLLQKIIGLAELEKTDLVLEIGPGLGALTEEIAFRARKVVAVEIDSRLSEFLKEKFQDQSKVQIVSASILDGLPQEIVQADSYKVVANIPFNLTGKVLRILMEQKDKPETIILVVQKEVAERIVARPPQMSLLSLSVQFYACPELVLGVNKSSFWPQPQVDSAVLKITPSSRIISKKEETMFFQLIKAGFSAKRKYLLNNLSKSAIIEKDQLLNIFKKISLNPKARAQELSLEQWLQLVVALEERHN